MLDIAKIYTEEEMKNMPYVLFFKSFDLKLTAVTDSISQIHDEKIIIAALIENVTINRYIIPIGTSISISINDIQLITYKRNTTKQTGSVKVY